MKLIYVTMGFFFPLVQILKSVRNVVKNINSYVFVLLLLKTFETS